jgi:hypothetical protein
MAKMKRLATDLAEFAEEIQDVLDRTEDTMPIAFNLLSCNDVTDNTKRDIFRNFTNDEELISLVLVTLDLKSQNNT